MRLMHSTRNWRDYTDPPQKSYCMFPNKAVKSFTSRWVTLTSPQVFLNPTCPICGDDVSAIIGDPDHVYCFECKVKFEMILGEDWQ